MEERFERYHPDMETLHRGFRENPCFICEVVAGTNGRPQHFIHEDEKSIAFLDSYPRAYGYTLVSPKEHREQVTADFTASEYLDLHRLVYKVAEAVREEVGAERMYIYTYGSNEGNAHVHWHVVPLPPGVPYEEQQGAWVNWRKGILDIPQEEMASLSKRIARRME